MIRSVSRIPASLSSNQERIVTKFYSPNHLFAINESIFEKNIVVENESLSRKTVRANRWRKKKYTFIYKFILKKFGTKN